MTALTDEEEGEKIFHLENNLTQSQAEDISCIKSAVKDGKCCIIGTGPYQLRRYTMIKALDLCINIAFVAIDETTQRELYKDRPFKDNPNITNIFWYNLSRFQRDMPIDIDLVVIYKPEILRREYIDEIIGDRQWIMITNNPLNDTDSLVRHSQGNKVKSARKA